MSLQAREAFFVLIPSSNSSSLESRSTIAISPSLSLASVPRLNFLSFCSYGLNFFLGDSSFLVVHFSTIEGRPHLEALLGQASWIQEQQCLKLIPLCLTISTLCYAPSVMSCMVYQLHTWGDFPEFIAYRY